VIAALAGAAIVLQVRGWGAIVTESGGSCGGRYGACPQGTLPVTVISLIVGIFTVPLALAMLFRRPRWMALVMVVGLVGGGFGGEAAFDFFHGPSLSISWTVPYDSPNTLVTEGVWVQGSSVVRVRSDEVVSYDSATGAAHWTFPIPGQNVVCAVSRTTAGDVGMIGYGPEDGACGQLVALDLTTGRKLWTTQGSTSPQSSGDALTDVVAAAGNVVAVAFEGGTIGYNARTGAQEWADASPSGCDDGFVGAEPSAVVVIATCDNSYVVADLDPATGASRWQTPVAEQATNYELGLVSVRPVVVDDSLPGARGTDDLRVFDPHGKQSVTIPVNDINTSDGPTSLDTGLNAGDAFGPQPLRWSAVSGDILAGATKEINGHVDLVGFNLTTGRQQWLTSMSDDLVALGQSGNQLVVIDQSEPSFTVLSVAMNTGSTSTVGVLSGQDFSDDATGLYPIGGHYVVVNANGTSPIPPVFAFGG
jgi:outer membrane protein assembly factor BamB